MKISLNRPANPRVIRHFAAAVSFGLGLVPASVSGASFTWDGGGIDDNWGTGANWITDGPPSVGATVDLIFDGSVRLNPFNNYTAWDDFHSLTFASGAGAFTLSGNEIDIFGKIENYSTATQTVSLNALAINGGQPGTGEFNPVNGDLVINSANVYTNGNNVRVFGVNNKTVTFGAGTNISQAGGVVVEQASNVVLLGANTYTGGTTLNAGTLTIGNGGTNGSIAAASNVSIAGGAAMTWNNNNSTADLVIANNIGGAGMLTLQGQNAVGALQTSIYDLSGNNAGFSGTLRLNRAILWNTTSPAEIGTAAILVEDRGTMSFNGGSYTNSITIENGAGWHHNVSGGDVVIGAIRLEGTNTLSGNITLNNTTGTVLGDNTGANSTIGGWSAGNHALNGVIGGPGDLAMSRYTSWNGGAVQAVNVTLGGSSSNTFTGKTVVDGQGAVASLILAKTGGAVAIPANTIVQFGSGTNGQANLRMGASEQFGAGVVMNFVNASGQWGRFDLQATSQTVAGINAGNLTTQGGAVIQNQNIANTDPGGNATLTLNGSGTYVYNGYMRDQDNGGTLRNLNLTKSGGGTQTLVGGVINHTGSTNVNQGRLILHNTTGYRSNTNIAGGATLEVSTPANWTIAGTSFDITGTGTLVKSGAGIWEIGAAGIQVGMKLGAGGLVDIQQGMIRNNYVRNMWVTNLAGVNVAGGATLDIFSENVQMDALTGAGTLQNGYAPNGVKTVTLGAAGGSGTFSGVITPAGGNVAITKLGAGTQTLSGNQITYTGATTVTEGKLVLFNATAFNSPSSIASGATLTWSGNADSQNNSTAATIALNSGGTLENTNPLNWTVINGAVTAGGTTTINHTSTATNALGRGFFLDGGLKGSGTVTINAVNAGSSVNFRNNNSTFSGTLIVNGVAAPAPYSPFAGSGISVGGATTGLQNADIQLNGTMELLNQGTGWANAASGVFRMGALSGTGVMVGNFTAGGVTTVTLGNTNSSGTFTGAIANGAGNVVHLVKTGSGTQTLAGVNIGYTGATTVNQGTLILDGTTALNSGAWSIASGAFLTVNTTNTAVDNWVVQGALTGTGTLTKTGAGWFQFRGGAPANFQGTILVNEGRFGNGFNSTVWTSSIADVFVASGAELDLRTDDMIVDELTGSGTIINTYSLGETNNTLTVGSNNGSSQFDGIIRGIGGVGVNNTSIDIGRNNLAKIGTGTFTLTGASVYGGSTTVNNGVVRIAGGNDRLPVATGLVVNGGATFGGTFDLNALNQTVATLSGGAGAVTGKVTNNATGTGTLTVTGTSTYSGVIEDGGAGKLTGLTKSGTGTLSLTGVNTHSGTTLITGGALREASATALSPNSNVNMNGGIVDLGVADFTAALGAGNGQLQFTGNGGFGAFGGTRIVNIGGAGGTMTWNAGNFVPTGSSLILSGPNSDSTTRFLNPIDLNAGAGRITSFGGSAAIDAEIVGNVGNGSLTLAPVNSTFQITGQVNGATIIENGATAANNMQVLLQRPGGNAVNAALQIGVPTAAATTFATIRLGASGQIADSTVVTFGATAGQWSYLNLYGFDETIGGLSNLPGADGGVVQLVEGDASPATNSTLTLNVAAGTQSYTGHIRDRSSGWTNNGGGTGRLNFIKTGAGTQEFTTWNNQTWSGTTAVQQGTLKLILNNGSNLPGAITVDPAATLELAPGGANNYNLQGLVSGAGTVVKSGTGTASLFGTVSLTGEIAVNQGRLRNDGNAVNWAANTANLTVAAAGTFDLRADSVRVNSLNGAGAITNSFGNGVGLYDTLTVGVAGGGGDFSGIITDFGTGSGENKGGIQLEKTGSGTQILSGNNTYTGITTISGGTLQIGNGGGSGTLGTGAVTNNSALVFERSDNSTAANAIGGTGTVAKYGTGTLTLTGTSGYSGTTTVAGGTLEISGANGALTATSGVSVTGGTLLVGGTAADRLNDAATVSLNRNSHSSAALAFTGSVTESVGALSLLSDSVIDMGSGATQATFSTITSWSGVLRVWNWTGSIWSDLGTDHLDFSAGTGVPTSAQLEAVQFYSDGGLTPVGSGATFLNGELVPVPEPGAAMSGLLLLIPMLWRSRRAAARGR